MHLTVLCVLYAGIVTFLCQLPPQIPNPSLAARANFTCLVPPGGGEGSPREQRKVLFVSGKRLSLDLGKAEQGVGAGRDGTAQGRAKSRKNRDSWT